jgi:pSer/pThr/pTyr-binding forkhead associated (FHA) protein
MVSRRHARITFRDGVWMIQDLSSTNGTTLNGERVGRATLRPGDILRLGHSLIQVD